MIISYEEFCDLLVKHIQEGEGFYINLLKTVIDTPSRYCGLFRLSNAKTKLLQNVTQSEEIKFGDVVEEVVTEYIERLGYTNFPKSLGKDENGDELNVDQYFTDGKTIYMAEMKIRDDHDSTKKRGQYLNFQKKINLIKAKHPNCHIDACMWFVDDSLVKNKKYYQEEMEKETYENVSLHLYYGQEYFTSLNNGEEAWNEFIEILKLYRKNNATNIIDIPDFGSSLEIYNALRKLPRKYLIKLFSEKEQYKLLRSELFSGGDNLQKINDEFKLSL